MLRLIENRQLEPSVVEKIKDAVEYYIQENQTEDFTFDDECYEGIDLDIVPVDIQVGGNDDDSASVSSDSISVSTGKTNPSIYSYLFVFSIYFSVFLFFYLLFYLLFVCVFDVYYFNR